MKRIFTLIIASIIINTASFAQYITPNENTEFCPLTSITFTVNLPRIATGTTPMVYPTTNTPILISGVSNLSHTSSQTTFTFVGQFRDVNINQVFKVEYVSPNGIQTSHDFNFKRVKSLFYGTSCTSIHPNQSVLNAPRCQVSNFSISFNNVQWSTAFESPALCFGSITAYEYLLPNGWSIDSNVSNGSNWIAGDNSVTITSDLSNGVNGAIYIRPVNNCSNGLTNGQSQVVAILINRTAPTLSIPETDVEICSGSKTYTITGLPAGATTSWSISNNYGISSISNQTNTSVQVNKINPGYGNETLTATVSHCSFTYTVTKVINFGVPTATFDIFTYLPLYADCFETDAFYIFRPTLIYNYDVYPPNYQWSYRINGTSTETIVSSTDEDGVFIFPNTGTYDILVRPVNSCGIGSTPSIKTITVQMSPACGGMGFRMTASPNPAINYINVTIDKETADVVKLSKIETISYRLYDINSATIIKQWVFDNTSNKHQLNVNDVKEGHYILVVQKDKYQRTTQIIISR